MSDATAPPTSIAAHALIATVRAYRWWLSPWLGSACRFEPTCSVYAIGAISRHGAIRGTWLTGSRLLRCHPFCVGGCDPVPMRATPSQPARRPLPPV